MREKTDLGSKCEVVTELITMQKGGSAEIIGKFIVLSMFLTLYVT